MVKSKTGRIKTQPRSFGVQAKQEIMSAIAEVRQLNTQVNNSLRDNKFVEAQQYMVDVESKLQNIETMLNTIV